MSTSSDTYSAVAREFRIDLLRPVTGRPGYGSGAVSSKAVARRNQSFEFWICLWNEPQTNEG